MLSRRRRPHQFKNNALQRQTRITQAFCAQNAAVSRITARARAFSRVCLGSMASRCIHAPHLQRIRALRNACISAPQEHRYTTSTGPTSLLAISAPPLGNHLHTAEDAPHAPAIHFLHRPLALRAGICHQLHRVIVDLSHGSSHRPHLHAPAYASTCARAMIYPPAAVTGLLRRPGRSRPWKSAVPPTLAAGRRYATMRRTCSENCIPMPYNSPHQKSAACALRRKRFKLRIR